MNKKGFSLVELLAVLAILAAISIVAIVGVSRYISTSKKEKVSQSKKNVAMATELYIQANRDDAPKAIGESTIIPLSTLKNKNYIKDTLTNEAGEDCMEKSFVRVYKLSTEEYSYTTYLYCGNEEVPDDLEIPLPVVFDFKFTGGNKNESGKYSSVKDAKFSFKMKGAKDDPDVGIYSNSYSLFTLSDSGTDNYVEVYNSGSIKGNLQTSIAVGEISLLDYIDVTGVNDIRIDVTVINEQGGRTDYSTAQSNENGSFQDTDKPVCGAVEGAAKDNNDWINKDTYGANGTVLSNQLRAYPARISVNCDDSSGSGCKREKFSKTWPNDGKSADNKVDYKYGTTWSYVEIEDNAQRSNKTKCYVRVNVDLRAPTINVNIYKAGKNGATGDLVKKFSVQESSEITSKLLQGNITANDYSDLFGKNEKWMNKENYPYGIIIKVSVTDNIGLKTWKFEANDENIMSGAAEDTIKSASVGEANAKLDSNSVTSGSFSFDTSVLNSIPQNDSDLASVEQYNTTGNLPDLYLNRNGMRYGKITVCDYANNCSVLHIRANIDNMVPIVPKVTYYKENSNTIYSPATASNYTDHNNWSNEYIIAKPSKAYSNDVSGINYYKFSYKKQKSKSGKTYTWYTAKEIDVSYGENSSYRIKDEGTHILNTKVCDNAGNCSNYNLDDYIKVDTIKPICEIKAVYQESVNGSYTSTTLGQSGWLKKGQRVKVSHTCSEKNSAFASSCDNDSDYNKQYFMFDFDINTDHAGANGYDNKPNSDDNTIGGHVIDYAGNISDECPTMTVKIDTVAPSCSTSISYPQGDPINPSDSNKIETGWLGMDGIGTSAVKKTAVISDVCDDSRGQDGTFATVSSGCDNEGKYDTNKYNRKTHTYSTEMKIPNGGADGPGKGGKVVDIAGNVTVCPADRTVNIDYTAPTCTLKTEYGTGTNASDFSGNNSIGNNLIDNWLGMNNNSTTVKRMAKVYDVCEDKGTVKSKCFGNGHYKIYDFEVNTENAGTIGYDNNIPSGQTISWPVYDKAGNRGECPGNQTVRIDYTKPVCSVTASSTGSYTYNQVASTGSSSSVTKNWTKANYTGYDENNKKLWLGKNAVVKVLTKCTSAESGKGNSSGCNTRLEREYTGEMSTTKATSNGLNANVYVYDRAGNRSDLCSSTAIFIDTTAPSCAVSSYYGSSTSNTYSGAWLKGDKTITVVSKCNSDKLASGDAGSGCAVNSISHTFSVTQDEVLNISGGSLDNGKAAYVYDNVGNGKKCGTTTVKLDYKAPDCTLVATLDGTTTVYNGSWTKQKVKVSTNCYDGDESGCNSKTKKSHVYGSSGTVVNTTEAGANGIGNTVIIKDYVGNETTCPNNRTVKVDMQNPTCEITQRPTNGGVSPQFIKSKCNDGSGSGCVSPSSNTLELNNDGDADNENSHSTHKGTYTYTYKDKVGNQVTCNEPYNVSLTDPSEVSCTYSLTYTKNGASTNKTTINVYGVSSATTVTYNNRGKNSKTVTESTSPVKCGKTYTAKITVGGNEYSCGSVTTPGCCDNDYKQWKDGDQNGTKTCSVDCGSGTYNRSTFSKLNGQYCGDTQASGGSNCSKSCKVYICRADCYHGADYEQYWYGNFSWTAIHKMGTEPGIYIGLGIAVGQNSTLELESIVKNNGGINSWWKIKDNSCAGDTQKKNPDHKKCKGGLCPGWNKRCSNGYIWEGCTKKSRVTYGDDSCKSTCHN